MMLCGVGEKKTKNLYNPYRMKTVTYDRIRLA